MHKYNDQVNSFLLPTLIASIALSFNYSARADVVNSADVSLSINYSFAGAIFTDSGLPAEQGTHFEFDGPPGHFYSVVGTFIFTEGDGSGSISGLAIFGSDTHTYNDPPPDFDMFDPNSDAIGINLNSFGQSSAPNSNGSAAINSVFDFSFINLTPDLGQPESLTLLFNYDYSYDMMLIEDAAPGGSANGLIQVEGTLEDDFGTTLYPDLVDIFQAGPAMIVDAMDSGQLEFVMSADSEFAGVSISTSVNSSTLVPNATIPEPSSIVLLGLLGTMYFGRRRRHG